jgi:predicted ATPase
MPILNSLKASPSHHDQLDAERAAVQRALINLLQNIIKRLIYSLQDIIERRLLPIPSEPIARIDVLQIIGFRCFPAITTLKCTAVTLIIGKNNTGKSNILESFRLCTADSFRNFLVDYFNNYGSEGLTPGLNFIFSRSSDTYYPPPMRLGFKTGETIYGMVIRRHSPFLFIEWWKNNELFCTLVSSDNFAKSRFVWGNEQVQSADGRTLTLTLTSKSIETHFEKLRPLITNGARIVYHRSYRDDRCLLDDLEGRLATQLSRSHAQLFLSKICSYFGIPSLQFISIEVINGTILPTPRQQREEASSFSELDALRQLIRDFKKRSHKKKLLGQVLAFVDELTDSVDPNRPSISRPGSGGLTLEHDRSLAKDMGSGFRALLLLCLEIETNDIILIDEPESFLHSSLQAKLASYILDETRNGKQFVIASHSEVFLNSFFGKPGCSVVETQATTKGCEVREIHVTNHLAAIIDDLGLKASYLLQSNVLIWVEGPSDRLYINHWIDCWSHGSLKEGVHYHCLSYGGRLLSHFSASAEEFADSQKIAMLRINRHAMVVIDSDRRNSRDNLNATKLRIIDEISRAGGLAWVTHGRTIENYIPRQVLQRLGLVGASEFGLYDGIDDFLATLRKEGKMNLGKVDLSRRVSQSMSRKEIEAEPNLKKSLDEICSRILLWNNLDI